MSRIRDRVLKLMDHPEVSAGGAAVGIAMLFTLGDLIPRDEHEAEITSLRAELVRHSEDRAALRKQLAEGREPLTEGRDHLTETGTFQSDKYQCPAGKVPLSVNDKIAQPLLWEYANLHEAAHLHGDSEFSRDLREALVNAGYDPND